MLALPTGLDSGTKAGSLSGGGGGGGGGLRHGRSKEAAEARDSE